MGLLGRSGVVQAPSPAADPFGGADGSATASVASVSESRDDTLALFGIMILFDTILNSLIGCERSQTMLPLKNETLQTQCWIILFIPDTPWDWYI